MLLPAPSARWLRAAVTTTVSLILVLSTALTAWAATLLQISTDTYTNITSHHATQVEPDSFAFGSTVVMVAQTGRFFDGGASNIAWSTSVDAGVSWVTGNLPGITRPENPANPYDRVSDPAVAYDARHDVWLISSLALLSSPTVDGVAVLTSRSTDGGFTWGNPVVVNSQSSVDKNWIACDSTPTSPFYGNCYTEWDDTDAGNRIYMSTSTDGGLTWGPRRATGNNATGLGGQPVVQPNGTVIVPIANANETSILSFRSVDGGATWSSTVTISTVTDHRVAGALRTGPLPSAEIDAAGMVYVVWQDCRFRSRCRMNDIVMSTSTDGLTWTAVVRIPIDPVNSRVDHFIPGLAVDRATSGSTARLALTYYYYPDTRCTATTCQLDVGYVSSANGGSTWTAPVQLAGPMTLSWLPNTSQGRMVGDYISTSFAGSAAVPVFALAAVPTGGTSCSTTVLCHQAINTSLGLTAAAVTLELSSSGEQPVSFASDHAAPQAPIITH